MKVSEYNQMMAYLTRKKPEVKRVPKVKVEKPKVDMVDHINRTLHMYEGEPLNENNKRRDHWEHLKKTGKLLEPTKQEEQRLKADKAVRNGLLKRTEKPIPAPTIDIAGFSRDLRRMDEIINSPKPEYKPPKQEKLEGIENILGIKAPK
jgi:hypothetical protein